MTSLNLRTSAKSSITRFFNTVHAENYNPDQVEIEHILGMVQQYWDRFVEHHLDLVAGAQSSDIPTHDTLYAATEEQYNKICIKLRRLLTQLTLNHGHDSARTQTADLRLDPVAIPPFDGQLENWLVFKDMFETMVHQRTDLEPTYKLSKLRQYVKPESVPMVTGLYTGGYDEVWTELKRRYDNPYLLSQTHVQRILALPTDPRDTQKVLRDIIDCVRNSFRALSVMGLPVTQWDALAIPILLPKLPVPARNEWGMSLKDNEIPKLENLLSFVERRAMNMPERPSPSQSGFTSSRHTIQRGARVHLTSAQADAAKIPNCPHCSETHRLSKCHRWRNLPVTARWDTVRRLRLCFNCLRDGHGTRDCSAGACTVCRQKHNTLLCHSATVGEGTSTAVVSHQTESAISKSEIPVSQPQVLPRIQKQSHVVQSLLVHGDHVVLLATAQVLLADHQGNLHKCRALCDMGSQVSFLSKSMFHRLNLRRRHCVITIEGVGQSPSTYTKGITTLNMHSIVEESFDISFDAYILNCITSSTPAIPVNTSAYEYLRDLPLADPTFGLPGCIDLLIGADIWSTILQDGVRAGGCDKPCALRTRLGWIVLGPTNAELHGSKHQSFSIKLNDHNLDELLQKFWDVDEQPECSLVDECERIFMDTFSRNAHGRYVVQIPFRCNAPSLGNSHRGALRQFFQLERKLAGDADLYKRYIDFMREYEQLGHMQHVPETEIDFDQCYYIPHHAVTAKFRVVFNASAKSSNGISLNDTQLVGPQLQDNLIHILHRFRKFEVAIKADVEKMFRQVEIDDRHRKWQQILWRESPNDQIRTYQLNTVTYGMACGPYNAIRSLRQCAVDNYSIISNVNRAAEAKESILSNFYVDDYLDSVDTFTEAIERARNVDLILRQGHFVLGKWNTNCVQTLTALADASVATTDLIPRDPDTTVLGLHWNPHNDVLFYKVRLPDANAIPTKRNVLSDVARLYDPSGLLSPVVVWAKIFIQMLWKAELSWDTPLPGDLRNDWLTFRNGLYQLSSIRVLRWLGMTNKSTATLQGFCDASSKAYAAVVYIRIEDPQGEVRVSLVAAKTRVGPSKGTTIPRMELSAARLLVLTMKEIRHSLRLDEADCMYWSDSTIVLHWIQKELTVLKPYVANRVAFIQTHSKVNCWRHIRSEYNPADCASRGIPPTELEEHQLWWAGPPILYTPWNSSHELPALSDEDQHTATMEGRCLRSLVIATTCRFLRTAFGDQRIPLVEKFSRLNQLLNTTARLRRILHAFRGHRGEPLTAEEREWALEVHIRQSQGNVYLSDINSLKSHSNVSSTSKLVSLNPFLDDKQILRVGGRLQNAELSFDQRHPIILAKDSALSWLLIADAHEKCLHGGIQEMIQYLRQRFWIIHMRALVKTFARQCVVCRRHQRMTQQQQMASLPRSRVLVSPPFTHTGLDYCGPFMVRLGGKRSNVLTKTYGAIFVCMATKAVHIELAENLTSRAFIDVFDRFISRRGIPAILYSDNGTQFVGAHKQLLADVEDWTNKQAKQHVIAIGTKWRFIAPAAPHHGGLWEAAVRSAKKHLYRTIGRQRLRFWELSTLLTRIEACLNSRPLVALHDDPEGGLAITPGEFLIGRPLASRPESTVPDIPENRLKYWQRLQRMYEHFWKRWQQDYLTSLQARGKWARPHPNLQRDDVVLILNENLPPAHWRIARVIEVHPGDDGLVRVVTVEYNSDKKSADGLYVKHRYQRPVQKLCRLTGPSEEILNHGSSAGQDV